MVISGWASCDNIVQGFTITEGAMADATLSRGGAVDLKSSRRKGGVPTQTMRQCNDV